MDKQTQQYRLNQIANVKTMSIEYYIQNNVGKVKYAVSWNDGMKKHKDGSKFFDIALFKSKEKLNKFISILTIKGTYAK